MKNNIKLSQLICHRMPERSFFFRGHQFPVCARCTGIYIGLFLALMMRYFNVILLQNNLLICFIFVFPLIFDGFTQFFNLRESNNLLRLITGFMFGLSYIFI